MAFIYSDGALEPEQVQETVLQIAETCNKSNGAVFTIFTDFAGDPVMINLVNVVKAKESE